MKRIFIILLSILLLVGCTHKMNQEDDKERIYLSNSYYSKGEFVDIKSNNLLDKVNDTYLLFTYYVFKKLFLKNKSISIKREKQLLNKKNRVLENSLK